MKCRDVLPLIYLIREGELTEEERQTVDRHVMLCPACAREYESVKKMTDLIHDMRPVLMRPLSSEVKADEVMAILGRPEKHMIRPVRLRSSYALLKGMAASMLIVITSTLIFQETIFYRSRSSVRVRFQHAEVFPSVGTESADCLARIKKAYRIGSLSSFTSADQIAVHTISEDQLKTIVEQVCGSDAADIRMMKKLMMQAGLLQMSKNKE